MIVALASALVSFLWQGLLLGIAFAIVRPTLRRTEASTRYVLLLGVLLLAPVTFGITFVWALSAPGLAKMGLPPDPLDPWSPRWAYVVAAVWATGVTTLGLRTGWEMRRLWILRATGLPLREWHDRLDRLRERLGISIHVALGESPAVQTPMVTGWLRPMILLPLGMATRMPPAWVESILAHELAHVRRYDFLLGIVQRTIEVALFFHPVTWWISAEIRRAREEACDDIVVDALQSPLDYARALTELASQQPLTPALAMGLDQGSLMSRIQHIVQRSPRPLRSPRHLPALGAALALGLVTALGCLTQLDADEEPTVVRSAEHQSESTVTIEVTADGYFIDGRPVDLEQIAATLAPLRDQPSASIRIAASRDSDHRQIVALMEEAKAHGIERLGILTRDEEGSSSVLESTGRADLGLSITWLPERVVEFEPEILAAAERHGVDPNLVAIVVLAESRGDPQARSPTGARGLMQVMPQTAARIAAQRGLTDHAEDRLDEPAYNLDLGTWFLARQLEDFGGGRIDDDAVALAAAAYNAGPKRLRAVLEGQAELSEETERYRSIVSALWADRALAESSVLRD